MARRFPIVIVPVLSSNRVSTSPAVSTARPDLVITLALRARSIPAIPIADSSPPIVVGMRHTNRDIIAAIPIVVPEYQDIGTREIHTIMKTKENAASNIVSAISLGVFCLAAPSTSAAATTN